MKQWHHAHTFVVRFDVAYMFCSGCCSRSKKLWLPFYLSKSETLLVVLCICRPPAENLNRVYIFQHICEGYWLSVCIDSPHLLNPPGVPGWLLHFLHWVDSWRTHLSSSEKQRVEERTLGWGMREKEAHGWKDDEGEPSSPLGQESCKRIDGYLSGLGTGWASTGHSGLSFCQEVRLEGEGGEVRGEPVKEAEELSDCLDNMHTCTYKHTHCHTDWRSCGPASRTFIPDRLFK